MSVILKDKYGEKFKVCSFPKPDIKIYTYPHKWKLLEIEHYVWGTWLFIDFKKFIFQIGWHWTVDYLK